MSVEGWRRNSVPGIAYSYLKAPKGPPNVTSPSEWVIVIQSTYSFTTNSLRRDLGFNSDIFEAEISRWVSAIPSNSSHRRKVWNFYPTGNWTQDHCARSDSASASRWWTYLNYIPHNCFVFKFFLCPVFFMTQYYVISPVSKLVPSSPSVFKSWCRVVISVQKII